MPAEKRKRRYPPISDDLRAERRSAFTLIELIITVVIVGILTSMAIAGYQRTMERGYWQTSRDILQTIYSGETVYWTTNSVYYAPGTWTNIHMDDPNGVVPATFAVVVDNGANPPTFTATATRAGGPCGGKTQTVDQARTFGGNWPQAGTPCP